MDRAEPAAEATDATAPVDVEFDAALKKVLSVVYKEHPLGANQLLSLAAELQRIGVHRLVEEHLRKFRKRQ